MTSCQSQKAASGDCCSQWTTINLLLPVNSGDTTLLIQGGCPQPTERNGTERKRPYLDNEELPEALDWSKQILSVRSSFLAWFRKKRLTSLEVDRGVWGAEPPRLTAGLFVSFVWNRTERNIWNGTGWNGYVYGTFGSGTGWNGCAPGTAGPARVPEKLLLERNGTERNGTAIPCINLWLGLL